jgi:hypothetical protein
MLMPRGRLLAVRSGGIRRYGYKSEAVRDADCSIMNRRGHDVYVPANGRWAITGEKCYYLEVFYETAPTFP